MGDRHGPVQSRCRESREMAGQKSAWVRADGSARRVASTLDFYKDE